jgi:hypothetical protein
MIVGGLGYIPCNSQWIVCKLLKTGSKKLKDYGK